MHPIERLRALARAREVDQSLLAAEAAVVLASMVGDPMGLVTACRRLIDRHPAAGALWWTCAHLLSADDVPAAARTVAREVTDDPAALDLSLELPADAEVHVVLDAAGGSMLDDHLAAMRDDLVVRVGEDAWPAQGWGRAVLVVESGAAGPQRFLAAPGTRAAIAEARDASAAVWLVLGVGRRLPASLFDALAARVPDGDVIETSTVDRVVEPRVLPCPAPAELSAPWRSP